MTNAGNGGVLNRGASDSGKVLLTGASGFVGSNVHPALTASGFDVVG